LIACIASSIGSLRGRPVHSKSAWQDKRTPAQSDQGEPARLVEGNVAPMHRGL